MVTTPDFAMNVEPGGSAGLPGAGVTLTFGALEAPPVYFNGGVVVVQTGEGLLFVQSALLDVQVTWRNTKIDLDTPAAAPAESSTRTTNEKVPTVVGLPVVLPPEDSANPGGRAPDEIDHL
jgi:hypothetical protein